MKEWRQLSDAYRAEFVRRERRFKGLAVGTAVCGAIVAILAMSSWAFGLVAVFLFFAAWNQWKELQRVQFLLQLTPPDTEETFQLWVEQVYRAHDADPLWGRVSQWVVGLVSLAIMGLVIGEIFMTGGMGMRIWVAGWLALAAVVGSRYWVRHRRSMSEPKQGQTPQGHWGDST